MRPFVAIVHQRAGPPARRHDAAIDALAHDLRVSESLADTTAAASARRSLVVVLVEDDDGLRAALVRLLRARCFETKSYASAEAVLADPDLDEPDSLVVDLNLPAMSGLDLVDRLRERGMTAPAVAITAHDEARVRAEVKRSGVEHFLAKPFLGTVLVALLIAIVGLPRPAGGGDI